MQDVKAVLFDVFGTVVDWRSSLIEDLRAFGHSRGITADWPALVDAWRGPINDPNEHDEGAQASERPPHLRSGVDRPRRAHPGAPLSADPFRSVDGIQVAYPKPG